MSSTLPEKTLQEGLQPRFGGSKSGLKPLLQKNFSGLMFFGLKLCPDMLHPLAKLRRLFPSIG